MKSKKTIINYSYVNAYAKAMYQNYIKARRLYIPLSGFLESKQEELADQKELLNKLNNLKNLK
jgi:putative SOS response-associated peptidase YedK